LRDAAWNSVLFHTNGGAAHAVPLSISGKETPGNEVVASRGKVCEKQGR
jgi:hypothetical protein